MDRCVRDVVLRLDRHCEAIGARPAMLWIPPVRRFDLFVTGSGLLLHKCFEAYANLSILMSNRRGNALRQPRSKIHCIFNLEYKET